MKKLTKKQIRENKLLAEAQKLALRAKNSGKGWRIRGHEIVCRDGRCSLGAIMFHDYIQVLPKLKKLNKIYAFPITTTEPDKFPDRACVEDALHIDSDLAEAIIEANDNSLDNLDSRYGAKDSLPYKIRQILLETFNLKEKN